MPLKKIRNSLIAICFLVAASCGLSGCNTIRADVMQEPIKTDEITWVCADPKPMPPLEDLLLMSGHQLFVLYTEAWLGHEDCWKTVKLNKDKLDADIAVRSSPEKK